MGVGGLRPRRQTAAHDGKDRQGHDNWTCETTTMERVPNKHATKHLTNSFPDPSNNYRLVPKTKPEWPGPGITPSKVNLLDPTTPWSPHATRQGYGESSCPGCSPAGVRSGWFSDGVQPVRGEGEGAIREGARRAGSYVGIMVLARRKHGSRPGLQRSRLIPVQTAQRAARPRYGHQCDLVTAANSRMNAVGQ